MGIEDFLRLVGLLVLCISIYLIGDYCQQYERRLAAEEFVSNVRREMEANPIMLHIIPVVNTQESEPSLPSYDQIMRGKTPGTPLLSMQDQRNH